MANKFAVLGCGARVDAQFVPLLERHHWYLDSEGYVLASIGNVRVALHNLVLGPTPPGMTADHKDRDRLNNVLENLRFVHYSYQNFNQSKPRTNTGERCITGMANGRYRARVWKDRKDQSKYFDTLEEAMAWRDEQHTLMYGEVSRNGK